MCAGRRATDRLCMHQCRTNLHCTGAYIEAFAGRKAVFNKNTATFKETLRDIRNTRSPITGHEGPEGEQMYSSTLPLTSALDWGWKVSATPRPLYPRQRPDTHCIGGWVGSRAGLDGCGKSRTTGIRSPDRPARSSAAIPTELSQAKMD